jgi:hypothetical protein
MCAVPGCRRKDVEVVFCGMLVCAGCWLRHCRKPFLKGVLWGGS